MLPKPTSLARFSRTGIGAKGDNAKIFVLDLTGETTEIRRSQEPPRRRDGREGQNPEHRHPAKSGDRRLAIEFRAFGEGKEPRSKSAHR